VTPEQAIAEAQSGKLRPVYVVTGDDTHLVQAVTSAIRQGAETGPAVGFNDDKFVAAETAASTVVNAAQTAAMMARQRLVVVTGVERWDTKAKEGKRAGPLDELANYAIDPMPSTVLVIVATKINGSRKLMRAAKKGGWLVSCQSPSQRELPGWIRNRCKTLGHPVAGQVAAALAELVGPELGPVADALERLSLYVGPGQAITEEALTEVVTRVRQETVWALVDALGARDVGAALRALEDAYDTRDGGLPLLGAVAWRVRQLLKFQAALLRGDSRDNAAKAAGVPPFRAGAVAQTLRGLSPRKLEGWLLLLAEADLALKGSRRGGSDVLATMLIAMCR
jgi:DNA polymerase-3 subunit delta